MASSGAGKTQNLNEGRALALQALLHSIAPETAQNDGKLTPDIVEKLSSKLNELVGDDAVGDFAQQRNERGELLNEEGLPIIDISEPLTSATADTSAIPFLANEEVPVPLASLPISERERRRRERDRILDLLEEEESREQSRGEALDLERRREALQKRKDAAKAEMEHLKAAKEMQKKMGKALLRNMVEAREREEKAQKEMLAHEQQAVDQNRTLKAKKSVSFADLPDEIDERSLSQPKPREKEAKLDWGDVAPARLQATNRPTLMTKARGLPMKMDVVERLPEGEMVLETTANEEDSDDETPPDSPVLADLDDSDTVHSDAELDHPDSDEDELIEPVLEDEYDLDFANHQREIALEYYSKRSTVGEAASKAMASLTHEEDERGGDWDQPTVPLEATLSTPHPKPAISHFKASRIASSYNSSLPSSKGLTPSSTRTLQRAIRTGKLESDNRLVGGDVGESASEEENETMQEVLELLKKGEVYNLGPDGKLLHPLPPSSSSAPQTSSNALNLPTDAQSPPADTLAKSLPANKPKISKFKLARSQAGRPAMTASPPSPASSSNTPISNVGRSSPKLPDSPGVESHVPPQIQAGRGTPNSGDTKPLLTPQVPMIVDSPSFLRPPGTRPTSASAPPGPAPAQHSLVVDSPSFPQNPPPTIVESPSFPQDRRTLRRPDRPPTVMSSAVRESVRSGNSGTDDATGQGDGNSTAQTAQPERKISRFMAERM